MEYLLSIISEIRGIVLSYQKQVIGKFDVPRVVLWTKRQSLQSLQKVKIRQYGILILSQTYVFSFSARVLQN